MRQQFSRYNSRKARERRFGSSEYHADAVHFDGSSFLAREAALTGAAGEYTTFLHSGWYKFPNTTQKVVSASFPNGFFTHNYALNTGNDAMGIDFYDEAFDGDSVYADAAASANAWFNVLIAYDSTDINKCLALVNGVEDTNKSFFNTNPPTLTGENNFFIGTADGVSVSLVCDAADLYFAFDQWLDLTNPANVAKFIADGKPVSLGADGSTPTGTAPTIFFSGNATGFGTNKGTGGAFTLNGSLTNASTSPSD